MSLIATCSPVDIYNIDAKEFVYIKIDDMSGLHWDFEGLPGEPVSTVHLAARTAKSHRALHTLLVEYGLSK